MDNFERFAKSILQGKSVAILAFAIFLLVLFFKHGDVVDSINLNLNMKKAEQPGGASDVAKPVDEEGSGTGSLKISPIIMAPDKFRLPSGLYVKIKSDGPSDALDVRIVLDFKAAEIADKDIRSTAPCDFKSVVGTSVAAVECSRLPVDEEVSLYFLLSEPSFEKITVSASNMPSNKTASWNNESSPSLKGMDAFDVFGWVFMGMICLVVLVGGIRFLRWLAFSDLS